MVEDDVVRFRRDIMPVLVHLRHLLGLDGAVDGRGGKAQHRDAHAEELHLAEHEERDEDRHQCVRRRHPAADPERDGGEHHPHTCDFQHGLLRGGVGRHHGLDREIAPPAGLQRVLQLPVAAAGRIEGFDDAHPLNGLEHGLHKGGLCPLRVVRDGGGLALHRRHDQQIDRNAREGDETDAPVKRPE